MLTNHNSVLLFSIQIEMSQLEVGPTVMKASWQVRVLVDNVNGDVFVNLSSTATPKHNI